MKKLFLFLLLMVTAITAMRAQDEPSEQTAAPDLTIQQCDTYVLVSFTNTDDHPDATIYYMINDYGFMVYDEQPIVLQEAGEYTVSAYAQAPGKSSSDVKIWNIHVPQVLITTPAHDFIVDGIYYLIKSDSTVWVSTKELVECTNDYNYQPHSTGPCYSGNVMIPNHVENDGKSYTVTGISRNAFQDCDLSNVSMPNTIESIDDMAFHSCTELRTIIIPESVTRIGQNVFNWCSNLTRVISKSTTPPHAFWTAFGYNYSQYTLFVPAESIETYRADQVWGKFTHIVPFIGAGPGDTNGDGAINITDVTHLIDQLLSGEEMPAYIDVNGNGDVNIADVTALIDYLLSGNW